MTLDSKTHSLFYLNHLERYLLMLNPLECEIYYRDYKLDLLTNKKTKLDFRSTLIKLKDKSLRQNYTLPEVYHFTFEAGYYFLGLDNLLSSDSDDPVLLVKIKYQTTKLINLKDYCVSHKTPCATSFKLIESPNVEDYAYKFNQVQENLLRGECYQVNLTSLFKYKVENFNLCGVVNKLWSSKNNRAHFSHMTYLHESKKTILSNSPECLFTYQNKYIYSLPIKGSIKVPTGKNNKLERELLFRRLKGSEKDQAELYMIADLIRNDLTGIELIPSEVISYKKQLDVPGLVHQYSKVRVKTSKRVNLYDVLSSLFPGGSISGAPKKNVMRIINTIEDHRRGHYCGSTVLLYKETKAASINIRTCYFDKKKQVMLYGAGGGITLKSTEESEFLELKAKAHSVINLLKKLH